MRIRRVWPGVMACSMVLFGCVDQLQYRDQQQTAVRPTASSAPPKLDLKAAAASRMLDKSMVTTASVYSQPNNCDALLSGGTFDTHNVFGSNFQQVTVLNRFCSANYSSYEQAQSDSASLGIPVDDLMASFGFSSNSSSFGTNYQTLCSQKDYYSTINQAMTQNVRTASAVIANAFVQCVQSQSQNFSAWVEPIDSTQFQVHVSFHGTAGQTQAKVISFDYDKSTISCATIPGNRIPIGGIVVLCRRTQASQVAQLALNTDAGNQGFEVPAYIPTPPPVTAVGDIVMSFLDEGPFASAHPQQQWLSCDTIAKNGVKKAPQGTAWVALTGNADLPDCSDRYPRSVAPGGTVGKTLADQVGHHSHTIPAHSLEAQAGHGFAGSGFDANSASGVYGSATYSTSDTGSGDGSETRPKTFVAKFYVRID